MPQTKRAPVLAPKTDLEYGGIYRQINLISTYSLLEYRFKGIRSFGFSLHSHAVS